jgi:hypothetical protein
MSQPTINCRTIACRPAARALGKNCTAACATNPNESLIFPLEIVSYVVVKLGLVEGQVLWERTKAAR